MGGRTLPVAGQPGNIFAAASVAAGQAQPGGGRRPLPLSSAADAAAEEISRMDAQMLQNLLTSPDSMHALVVRHLKTYSAVAALEEIREKNKWAAAAAAAAAADGDDDDADAATYARAAAWGAALHASRGARAAAAAAAVPPQPAPASATTAPSAGEPPPPASPTPPSPRTCRRQLAEQNLARQGAITEANQQLAIVKSADYVQTKQHFDKLMVRQQEVLENLGTGRLKAALKKAIEDAEKAAESFVTNFGKKQVRRRASGAGVAGPGRARPGQARPGAAGACGPGAAARAAPLLTWRSSAPGCCCAGVGGRLCEALHGGAQQVLQP
jgi:hypothetical protein